MQRLGAVAGDARAQPGAVRAILSRFSVARAEANIGKPYALFAQNCEHFASFAFTGKAESTTVATLGWMVAGALAVAALTAD